MTELYLAEGKGPRAAVEVHRRRAGKARPAGRPDRASAQEGRSEAAGQAGRRADGEAEVRSSRVRMRGAGMTKCVLAAHPVPLALAAPTVAPLAIQFAHATVPRPPAANPRRRRGQGRPHRHRHAERLRPPDAVRPGRRLSAGDDEEGASEVDHLRAAVVSARRDERSLSQRARRHDLGRVGRRAGRARPGVRLPVAIVDRAATAKRSIRSATSSSRFARSPIRGG